LGKYLQKFPKNKETRENIPKNSRKTKKTGKYAEKFPILA
jgi:hypothetical protein